MLGESRLPGAHAVVAGAGNVLAAPEGGAQVGGGLAVAEDYLTFFPGISEKRTFFFKNNHFTCDLNM